jgi:hypothetical protein
MKIANKDARLFVQKQHPFEGSNMYAQFKPEGDGLRYIVYSYGEHFPMYIHCKDVWFENEDKYSPTTSKHMSQARPTHNTILLSSEWMRKLASEGYVAIASSRILGEPV